MHIAMAAWAICQSKGGSERMAALTATEMSRRGHKITLFHRNYNSNEPVFPLPAEVSLVGLRLTRRHMGENARIVKACDPDLFFSFGCGPAIVFTPLLLRNTGIPSLVSLHHNPAAIMSYALPEYEYFGALATADFIQLINSGQYHQLPPALLQRCAALKGKTRLDRLGPPAIWTEDALNRAACDMLRPDYVPLPPPGAHASFIDEREDLTRAEVRAMRVYDFFPRLVNRLLSLPLFRGARRRAQSSNLGDWSLSLRYQPWDYSLRKERLLTAGQQWALWFFRMPKWLARYARRRLPLLWRHFVADFYRYATPPGNFFRPLPQETEDSSPLPEKENGPRSKPWAKAGSKPQAQG